MLSNVFHSVYSVYVVVGGLGVALMFLAILCVLCLKVGYLESSRETLDYRNGVRVACAREFSNSFACAQQTSARECEIQIKTFHLTWRPGAAKVRCALYVFERFSVAVRFAIRSMHIYTCFLADTTQIRRKATTTKKWHKEDIRTSDKNTSVSTRTNTRVEHASTQ